MLECVNMMRLVSSVFVPVKLAVSFCQWKLYRCSSQQKYVFWSNNILCESHEMSFVHPKHAFMPCWIAVEYVARVLHFSASSYCVIIGNSGNILL